MTSPSIHRATGTLWDDAAMLRAFELIADGITDLVGFGIAVINLVRGDELVVVAVAGLERGVTQAGEVQSLEEMIGQRWPIATLEAQLAIADDWGRFKFVPADRAGAFLDYVWIPEISKLDAGDAWDPLDFLAAPVYDRDGAILGAISIDAPLDGRRPNEARRAILEKYAEHTSLAIVTAVERHHFAERARLLGQTGEVIRRLSETLDPDRILSAIHDELVVAFDADSVVMQTFRDGASDFSTVEGTREGQGELIDLIGQLARESWEAQTVHLSTADTLHETPGLAPYAERIRAWLGAAGIDSWMFAPIGAGPECLGAVLIARSTGRPGWTNLERDAARELGQDLGWILQSARAYEREQQLVRELRELEAYKNDLVSAVSHELDGPLSSIIGNVELLSDLSRRRDRTVVDAVQRDAQRMARVVDGLLYLSRVADPDHPREFATVDLHELLRRVVDLAEPAAARSRLTVQLRHTPAPPVRGDVTELERALMSLVSNAVRFTPDGGRVVVGLRAVDGGAEMSVSDTGIGISEEDRPLVFTEFFRSGDPAVQVLPGSGLGLAIVNHIVRRHGGRIDVESALGEGSTFRVWLPAAP